MGAELEQIHQKYVWQKYSETNNDSEYAMLFKKQLGIEIHRLPHAAVLTLFIPRGDIFVLF